MSITLQEFVFDCNNVVRIATFWSKLLDKQWAMVSDPDWAIVDLGDGRHLGFQLVPEPKMSAKNRLHLDLQVEDLAASEAFALECGATSIEEAIDREDGTGYVVMQDPEGNEFCLVRDLQGTYDAAVAKALAETGRVAD